MPLESVLEELYENADSPYLQEARAKLNNNTAAADKPPSIPPKIRNTQQMSTKKLNRLNTLKKSLAKQV